MAGPTDGKARPLVKVAVVMAVALLAYVGYRLASGPAEDAPVSRESPAPSSARRDPARGADRRGAHEPREDRVAAYDPARLAPLLLDGGPAPATLEAVDRRLAAPSPVPPAQAGEGAAPSTEAEASPVSTAPIVEWRREPTVESDLRRAVFLRGLLEGQIEELRERADEARARGDEASAARHERRLERLSRERPAIEAHVSELEAEAAPEEAPPEDQGSY